MASALSSPRLALLTIVLASAADWAAAATRRVPQDYPTIQAAIDAAAPGDTVSVAPGIYAERLDNHSKPITIQSTDGPNVTIVDAGHAGTAVRLTALPGESPALRGFTIRNGLDSPYGGGIHTTGGPALVEDNVVTGSLSCAGGIAVSFSEATVRHNLVTGTRENCSIGFPAGIYVGGAGAAVIDGNVITDNIGGIVLVAAGTPVISGNRIDGNLGAGVDLYDESNALIVNNVIAGNVGDGVRVMVPSGQVGPTVVNNTVIDNRGAAILADGFYAQARIVNNILRAGRASPVIDCSDAYDATPPVIAFNDVVHTGEGLRYGGVCTDQTGVAGNISVDPGFATPGEYRPPAGSPVIDAGTPTDAPATDVEDASRPIDGDGDGDALPDLGAHEFRSLVPTITTQPVDRAVPIGSAATFAVAAMGPALTYQWYQGASGSTAYPVAAATAPDYVTDALTAPATYWVQVANAQGAVRSRTVRVAVGTPPAIVTQPAGGIVYPNQSTTVPVIASGTAPLVYQWYIGSSGDTSTPLPWGGSTLLTPPLTTTTMFWVRVSNAFGSVDSGAAVVAVRTPPQIVTEPQSQSVPIGQTATLTVSVTGTPPFWYQWYRGSSPAASHPVEGARAASFTTPPVTAVDYYWVRVSNGVGIADSRAAVLTPLPLVGEPREVFVQRAVGRTITLAWTLEPGQQAVTHHLVEGGWLGTSVVLAVLVTGSPAPTFTFTAPPGAFFLRVRAAAGATVGRASPDLALCVDAGCPPVMPLNVLGLANGSDLTLAWRTPLESGVPARIRLSVSGTLEGALDLPGTAEGFAYRGVPAGTYQFRLQACTAVGCSTPTPPVPLTFPGACGDPPATPARIRAAVTGRIITVDWDLPASGPPPVSHLLQVGGAFTGAFPVPGRSISGTVEPGTYTFSVSAVTACGTSAATAAVPVTVP